MRINTKSQKKGGKEQKKDVRQEENKQQNRRHTSNHINNYTKSGWTKSSNQKAEIFQLDKAKIKRLHFIFFYLY